ncbi:hypothetical protein GGR52DRAFT_577175 [Hypoxylon sp. FL1284]|nr:hypothetical protein GGR52DRAFT_577175 [Hypoxylon sp. FL1284]
MSNLESFVYCLGALGTVQTWGRVVLDGSINYLLPALYGTGQYTLPGTHFDLRTSFTGIYYPVDFTLRTLVIFFYEAVDGSHPTTSAIGIYFLGQYFGCLFTMYTDYLRGPKSRFLTITLWILLFQLTAFAASGWLWALSALSQLAISIPPNSKPDRARQASAVSDTVSELVMLLALILGYGGSAVLMALPSPGVVSNDFQQFAVAGWNMFPVLVLGAYWLLLGSARLLGCTKGPTHLVTIRIVNSIALVLTSAFHWGVTGLSVAATLFPAAFAPGYAEHFRPDRLALPPIAITQSQTFGDGVRSFILWDQVFGYALSFVVTLAQVRAATLAVGKSFSWPRYVLGAVGLSIVLGPGSACLMASWWRDEMLFA